MPDPIGVLVIAWMVFGVACLFAIEFGRPPSVRPAHDPDRAGTTPAAPVAGCPQPDPPSTPAADHAGRSWRRRPRLRP